MDSVLGIIREMTALGWEPAGILATVRSVLEAEERRADDYWTAREAEADRASLAAAVGRVDYFA